MTQDGSLDRSASCEKPAQNAFTVTLYLARLNILGCLRTDIATIRFCALFAAIAMSALALDLKSLTSDYIRTDFTVEDGLPSNVVNAIVQTRNGFLWVGTDAGLVRFQ